MTRIYVNYINCVLHILLCVTRSVRLDIPGIFRLQARPGPERPFEGQTSGGVQDDRGGGTGGRADVLPLRAVLAETSTLAGKGKKAVEKEEESLRTPFRPSRVITAAMRTLRKRSRGSKKALQGHSRAVYHVRA